MGDLQARRGGGECPTRERSGWLLGACGSRPGGPGAAACWPARRAVACWTTCRRGAVQLGVRMSMHACTARPPACAACHITEETPLTAPAWPVGPPAGRAGPLDQAGAVDPAQAGPGLSAGGAAGRVLQGPGARVRVQGPCASGAWCRCSHDCLALWPQHRLGRQRLPV